MFDTEGNRVCNECGSIMIDGFVVENGAEHYCSKECLNNHYSDEEFNAMYDNGNGDSYYTEWYDEDS